MNMSAYVLYVVGYKSAQQIDWFLVFFWSTPAHIYFSWTMACGQLGSPHSCHPGPSGHRGGAGGGGRCSRQASRCTQPRTTPTLYAVVDVHVEGPGCQLRLMHGMSTLEFCLLGPVHSAGMHCSCAKGLVLGVQDKKWVTYRKTVYRKSSADGP